jgi:hypothetical protein
VAPPEPGSCDPSEALFHVTSFASLPSIAQRGLVPRSGGGTFSHGGYDAHSQGKVFLACGRDAALAWYGKVQDQLHHHFQDDEEPDALVPVLLMVLSDLDDMFLDEIGDRDVPGSVYVLSTVAPGLLWFWSPEEEGWVPVEEWDDEDPYGGVESIEHYDADGEVVDEDDDWESRGFEVYGPYEPGGFKPDPDDDESWEPF